MGAVLAGLAGVNVVSGPGMMDFENCLSLEKLIIDHEICGMIHRLVRGIEPRGSRLAADLYGDLEAGDLFFTSEHTLNFLRREIAVPGPVIDRDPYEVRRRKAGYSIGERSHQRLQELLSIPAPQPLAEPAARELHRIMTADAERHGLRSLPDRAEG